MVTYTGVIEYHDKVEFHQMKPSLFTKMIAFFMRWFYDEDRFKYLWGVYFIPDTADLYSQLKSFKPDVVIIRNYSLMALSFILICKILGIKNLVIYIQEPLYGKPQKSNLVKEFVRNRLFPHSVFTPVLYKGDCRTKDTMSNRAKYFVPLVCDIPQTTRSQYLKNGKIRILDVGKYREYKNHFFVVEAFSKVMHPENFEVTIIGQLSSKLEQDYYNRLKNYIKEKKLENIIHLRGHVDYKEMDEIYTNSDVLLLASKSETAGMVILEAMAKGLCVISGFNCGLTSYIDEYDCGLSFSEKHVPSLVEILDNLVENRQVIGEMGMKAQQIAKEEFCFDKYKTQLNKLLQKEYNYNLPV